MTATTSRAPRDPLRVVLTGGESSGKTTLAAQLAAHYGVPWAPEYVRDFVLREGRQPTWHDHGTIARAQLAYAHTALTAARAARAPVVFFDTDLASTVAYLRVYHGHAPPWLLQEARLHRGDLYLLCEPDLPWESDGVRDRPDDRAAIRATFAAVLHELGADCRYVTGLGAARLELARAYVDAALGDATPDDATPDDPTPGDPPLRR